MPRARLLRTPTAAIITLGCSKNTVDSERLAAHLRVHGVQLTEPAEAETLILNTCGFIEAAKQESIEAIMEALELKRSGQVRRVIVSGCLSARYAEVLRQELPEVDYFFGTEAYEPIVRAVTGDFRYELVGEREVSTPQHYAYLKIAEGCDHPCSFCAIPLIRGRYRSRPIELVLQEAQWLVQRGARELILIAQDTTYYGVDLYGKRCIADLVAALSSLEGVAWIRLLYAYPAHFPEELLEVMADHPNVCRYIDLPLQHISTPVLSSMRRGVTRRSIERLLERIRSRLPGITLRTTFIVGYPNETEERFAELYEFVRQARFERMGVFPYSHEEGTAAWILGDPIPPEVKQERLRALMELQREISLELNRATIGKSLQVLIDEQIAPNEYRGRTERDAPEIDNEVFVRSERPLEVGTFVTVSIEDATDYELYGVAADC
ncbi:MAG: 30S ribosomal protein S12 methylthiotransferase RimO [Candidatus Kapabacteria bacterium]|nr:30S ribosomal protein S12 methylthiotransferase RimO [Candidatus Kapabacteria bacterium]MDW8012102.1 30S ribosomal protein S12 methylthiotransferase RimO [Bacteroidota bacterium]